MEVEARLGQPHLQGVGLDGDGEWEGTGEMRSSRDDVECRCCWGLSIKGCSIVVVECGSVASRVLGVSLRGDFVSVARNRFELVELRIAPPIRCLIPLFRLSSRLESLV